MAGDGTPGAGRRRSRRTSATSLLVALVLSLPCVSRGSDGSDLWRRYLEELPYWQDLLEHVQAKAVITEVISASRGSEPLKVIRRDRFEYEFSRSGGKTKLSRIRDESEPDSIHQETYVNDSSHTFIVRRPSGSAPFRLSSRGDADSRKEAFLAKESVKYFLCPTSIDEILIPRVIGEGGFHLKKAESTRYGEKEAARFEFAYTSPEYRGGRVEGSWTVQPSLHWALVEYEIRLVNPEAKFLSTTIRGTTA
jgi:hypothetical protein